MAWAGNWATGDMLEEDEDTEAKSPKRSRPAWANVVTGEDATAMNGLRTSPFSCWGNKEKRDNERKLQSLTIESAWGCFVFWWQNRYNKSCSAEEPNSSSPCLWWCLCGPTEKPTPGLHCSCSLEVLSGNLVPHKDTILSLQHWF